jgi:hypothetical protein
MSTHRSVKRFDLGEMREATTTPQGFLLVPGFATRTGVFPYMDGNGDIRRELRHPDDVFDPKSLATLKYAPVTLEHPPVTVSPENAAQYSKGHTTERVEVNREMVDVDLIVEHQDAIDAVQKGGIRELSSGYIADIVEEEGTYNGAPYNFRQINIRYNHLAMVRKGRAGPEVRMRLDAADAVMRNDEVSIPARAEMSQESAVSDADIESTKTIVIAGKEVQLQNDVADAIQDMFDRYDEMRAKQSELEEQMAKSQDRKDVDINGPKPSPQMKVEQQGADGRGASGKSAAGGKIGPGEKTVHPDSEEEKEDGEGQEEQGGMSKNSRDADMEDKKDEEKDCKDAEEKEEKKDYEAAPAGQGGGAATSPVDQLKKDLDEARKNFDVMAGKMDAMAAESMNKGEAKPDRMDSKAFRSAVQKRVKLERTASKLVPFEVAAKFDSMTDEQIQKTVIKHVHPKADLADKSPVYLQSRFDSIIETHEESSVEGRREIGRQFMERKDADEVSPDQARLRMIKETREQWKQPLSGSKK